LYRQLNDQLHKNFPLHHVLYFLNGENVVSTTMWDDNWNKMIAASKFKQWPGFGTFKKGRICLQDHGNYIWFRNIKIKKL
jgi:hypothetical protein